MLQPLALSSNAIRSQTQYQTSATVRMQNSRCVLHGDSRFSCGPKYEVMDDDSSWRDSVLRENQRRSVRAVRRRETCQQLRRLYTRSDLGVETNLPEEWSSRCNLISGWLSFDARYRFRESTSLPAFALKAAIESHVLCAVNKKPWPDTHSSSVFRYSRKSFPRSFRFRANSTVALRNPSLSPASWRLPSKVKP